MRQIKTTLLFISFFFAFKSFGQFNADSIIIFKNSYARGTTADLRFRIHKLDSISVDKQRLIKGEVNELIEILSKTNRGIYMQQKHGGDGRFAIIYYKGLKYFFVIEASLEFGRLVNLSTGKRWTLKMSTDKMRLYEWVQKNWL